MNRSEDRTIRGLDHRAANPARSARFAELNRMAEQAVAMPIETREDAVTFLRLVVGHAFSRLTGFDTRHQTRAYFGQLASGDDFQSLAKSLAWADAQWAKVTTRGDEAA